MPRRQNRRGTATAGAATARLGPGRRRPRRRAIERRRRRSPSRRASPRPESACRTARSPSGRASRGSTDSPPRATIMLAEPGSDQAADAAGEQRKRRRAGRQRQPEPLQHEPARRRLHDEGDEARRRVVDREEAEEVLAAAECLDRPRLEQIVDAARRPSCRAGRGPRDSADTGPRQGRAARSGAGRERLRSSAAVVRCRSPRIGTASRRICHALNRWKRGEKRAAWRRRRAAAATRSASSALSSPPSVPAPAIWPKRRLGRPRIEPLARRSARTRSRAAGRAPEMCR